VDQGGVQGLPGGLVPRCEEGGLDVIVSKCESLEDSQYLRHLPNLELYRSQWFAAETLARADLATHQDAAVGWTLGRFTRDRRRRMTRECVSPGLAERGTDE
jgi:hypothetical protein